ncbi:MAG: hypothetical protein M3396_01925 [Actinomycetota bacterium]|nr:hypothetical protein [Actinomycetota bacterium]
MPGKGTRRPRTGPSVICSSLIPLLVLAACGADEPGSGRHAGATTVPGPAASASTTTTPAGLGDCPAGIGAAAQDPDQAARCLYAAWREDSRARAAVFASLDVVDSLFARRWSPPEGNLRPCVSDPDIGALACGVDYHGAQYFFDVRRSEGGWRVTQLRGPQ